AQRGGRRQGGREKPRPSPPRRARRGRRRGHQVRRSPPRRTGLLIDRRGSATGLSSRAAPPADDARERIGNELIQAHVLALGRLGERGMERPWHAEEQTTA